MVDELKKGAVRKGRFFARSLLDASFVLAYSLLRIANTVACLPAELAFDPVVLTARSACPQPRQQ